MDHPKIVSVIICYDQLTHYGLVVPYGIIELVNVGSGNGLLPDSTSPLPEQMLTNICVPL